MAVKEKLLTQEDALQLAADVVVAQEHGNTVEVGRLMARTRPKRFTSKDIILPGEETGAGDEAEEEMPVFSPDALRRLDDAQRLQLLHSVAKGELKMEEAMARVGDMLAKEELASGARGNQATAQQYDDGNGGAGGGANPAKGSSTAGGGRVRLRAKSSPLHEADAGNNEGRRGVRRLSIGSRLFGRGPRGGSGSSGGSVGADAEAAAEAGTGMLEIAEEPGAALGSDLAAAPALQGFRSGPPGAPPMAMAMGGIFGGEDDDLEGPVAMEYGSTSLLDTFASSLFKDAPKTAAGGSAEVGAGTGTGKAAALRAANGGTPSGAGADKAPSKPNNPFADAKASGNGAEDGETRPVAPSPKNPFAGAKQEKPAGPTNPFKH
jgi:hypothetical protein